MVRDHRDGHLRCLGVDRAALPSRARVAILSPSGSKRHHRTPSDRKLRRHHRRRWHLAPHAHLSHTVRWCSGDELRRRRRGMDRDGPRGCRRRADRHRGRPRDRAVIRHFGCHRHVRSGYSGLRGCLVAVGAGSSLVAGAAGSDQRRRHQRRRDKRRRDKRILGRDGPRRRWR